MDVILRKIIWAFTSGLMTLLIAANVYFVKSLVDELRANTAKIESLEYRLIKLETKFEEKSYGRR